MLQEKWETNQRRAAAQDIIDCINKEEPRVNAIAARAYDSAVSKRAVSVYFIFEPSKEDARTEKSRELAIDAEMKELTRCLLASPFEWYTLNMVTLQYLPMPYVDRDEIGFVAQVKLLIMFGRESAEILYAAPSFGPAWDELAQGEKKAVFLTPPPIVTVVQANAEGFDKHGWNQAVDQWKSVRGVE